MTTRKKATTTGKSPRPTARGGRKKPAGTRSPRATAKPAAAGLSPGEVGGEMAVEQAIELGVPPEPGFAAGRPPREVERPRPSARRAVFFDVENTSRAEHVGRVLAELALDRAESATELVAVGNWRVIGHETARLLARHGAHLVHSAPSVGVRDWSDLRIAVGAGVWLAGTRPGDAMEIVSDDQAFDAVGDVAASLGVVFRRLSYRALAGVTDDPAPAPASSDSRARRRRRGGRRGRRSSTSTTARTPAPAAASPTAVANGAEAPAEPQTAPYDEVLAVVRELLAAVPSGQGVTIDALSNALKARGFSRPPGSPRLVTRLRRIRAIAINRTGLITLAEEGRGEPGADGAASVEAAGEVATTSSDDGAGEGASEDATTEAAPDGSGRPRRRRRRGGRRRRGRGAGAAAAAPPS